MTSTDDAGIGHGSNGKPQTAIEEEEYAEKIKEIKNAAEKKPKYSPSLKHEPGSNWGSENPIKSIEEGQKLLENGYKEGKQVYNLTAEGKMVKFQPDGTPENGYHSYEVFSPPDIPPAVLKRMYADGRISRNDYKKYLKGKNK